MTNSSLRIDAEHTGGDAANWPTRPHLAFWQLPHGVRVLTRLPTVENGAAASADQTRHPVPHPPQTSQIYSETLPLETERRLFVGLGLPDAPQLFSSISPAPSAATVLSQADTGCLADLTDIPLAMEYAPASQLVTTVDKPALVPSSAEAASVASGEPTLPADSVSETPATTPAKRHVVQPIPGFMPTILDIVARQARALRWEKSRVVQWHLAQPEHLAAVRLIWSLAQAWAGGQQWRLLLIDATDTGAMANYFGWQTAAGWGEVITAQTRLSETLCQTPWPAINFLGTGHIPSVLHPDFSTCLAALLQAVQRDYPATWVVTGGPWSPLAQHISQLAHERQLVLQPSGFGGGETWHGLRGELLSHNVLIDGWIALESPADVPSPAAPHTATSAVSA